MRIKTGICHKFAFILPFLGVLGGLCSPASLLAENFFSFGGGVLYPQNVTNVTATENGNYPNAPIPALDFPGTRDSDLQLDNAGAVDVKVGHFLEDHPWLGCEAEYLHANPNFPEQIVALTNPAFVPLAGISTIHQEQLPASISMNLLHFDFLARYPGETFQPYVGVGLGVIFTKVSGEGRSGIILERPGSGEGCAAVCRIIGRSALQPRMRPPRQSDRYALCLRGMAVQHGRSSHKQLPQSNEHQLQLVHELHAFWARRAL